MIKTRNFWLLFLMGLAGCTNKAIYENIQRSHKQDCLKEPYPTYERCIELLNKPYESYKREREELLESDSDSA